MYSFPYIGILPKRLVNFCRPIPEVFFVLFYLLKLVLIITSSVEWLSIMWTHAHLVCFSIYSHFQWAGLKSNKNNQNKCYIWVFINALQRFPIAQYCPSPPIQFTTTKPGFFIHAKWRAHRRQKMINCLHNELLLYSTKETTKTVNMNVHRNIPVL